VDAAGNVTTFVENSNQTNAMGGTGRAASSRCSAREATKKSACCIPPTR
jgi:hypothetical protein